MLPLRLLESSFTLVFYALIYLRYLLQIYLEIIDVEHLPSVHCVLCVPANTGVIPEA